MKARNLLIGAITVWLMTLGGLAFGDDDMTMEPVAVATELQVNINTATAEMIAQNLTGVGLKRAEAIVAYRDSYGPFYSAEELTAVRGIGKSTVEKNAGRIVIE